jgi:hypothetical protein
MSGTQCFSVVWLFPGTGLSSCGIADVELGWAGANYITVVLKQGYGKHQRLESQFISLKGRKLLGSQREVQLSKQGARRI